ncbi:PREDICTED: cytochrome P450 4V2-like, partial [Wasmannia auropunctata]|uniref:cytochrome P450 4V2-like n=1 Tax=Wasmannia auropunctata TaxID=64793 RepID=UPI0005EDF912
MKELCQRRFTQKTIRDNIITIIFAAIDTTSMTLYFVIFILSNFPEIQNKLYKELLKIYGTENLKSAPIKYEDLQYMSYLECVIKETMTIFPTVPITGRKTTKDVKMGEFILPKGANIIINSMLMHRNKNYWPNPWKFDPDRFLPDKMNNHSYYYLPFSDGPRNCI